MPRIHRVISIVLLLALIAMPLSPSFTSHAQGEGDVTECEGTGIFYWPCLTLGSIFSAIQNFFNWVVNTILGFFRFIGDVFNWILTTVGNIFSFFRSVFELLLDTIRQIFVLIGEALQILGLVVSIIIGFIGKLGSWMVQAVGMIIVFLGDFFSTSPIPFPGTPKCITAPVQHDICGVWYMIDNTFLGGNISGIILIVCLIIIDVAIVFLFARRVLGFLKLGETVTDVT